MRPLHAINIATQVNNGLSKTEVVELILILLPVAN